jgi:hypothetical protein
MNCGTARFSACAERIIVGRPGIVGPKVRNMMRVISPLRRVIAVSPAIDLLFFIRW